MEIGETAMDWIKVKTKHYLNTDLTLLERGAFITIQLLTAQLERIPTEKEMLKHVSKKSLSAIADRLDTRSTTLAEVLDKVCEDVAKVSHGRSQANDRKKKERTNSKKELLSHVTAPRQIREDKIREDKNKYKEYVYLSEDEYKKLETKLGEKDLKEVIVDLNTHIGSKGTKYKSHYYTILAWDRRKTKGGNYGKTTNRTQQSIDAGKAYIAKLERQESDSDTSGEIISITEFGT